MFVRAERVHSEAFGLLSCFQSDVSGSVLKESTLLFTAFTVVLFIPEASVVTFPQTSADLKSFVVFIKQWN